MAEIFNRRYENLVKRRQRVLDGKLNCIPFGFPRFERELPGIEQGKYYLFTANSKVGKTQIADNCFMYNPFEYAYKHREEIRLKIHYFSLEMSIDDKYDQFICHLLFMVSKSKLRVTPKDLKSTSKDNPLSQEILDLMCTKEYQDYFEFFEQTVVFIEDVRNPYGIFKHMKDYADNNGVSHRKDIDIVDNNTGEITKQSVFDYYEPNDPDEYVICMVDHASLLGIEGNGSVKQSIDKLSSDYFIRIRNRYNYIPVLVQQQQASQEGIENFKLGKLKPTLDGLAESKLPGRDANFVIGLFSPFRYEVEKYLGYDITYWKDNIRFMELIASRGGGGGTVCPLFFDGGVNYFRELPLPSNSDELRKAMTMTERVRSNKICLLVHKRKLFK